VLCRNYHRTNRNWIRNLPALRVSRDSDLTGLREGTRAGGGRKAGLRSALIVIEVTLSMVLLISAGLLLRALMSIQAVDPGFRSDGVLTMQTALPMPKYENVAKRKVFYQSVLSEIEALPGVSNAAYSSFLPMTMGGGIWPVDIDGKTIDRSEGHNASLRFVTPGYFATLEIPLLAGRNIDESDVQGRPVGAVVSDSLARRYWPGQSALGRHFKFAYGRSHRRRSGRRRARPRAGTELASRRFTFPICRWPTASYAGLRS
jgi:hypothetical protein